MNKRTKNTMIRILTAVVALPVYVFLIVTNIFHSLPILIVSVIVSGVCLWEFYQIAEGTTGYKPFVKTGIIFGVIINMVMYSYAYGNITGIGGITLNFDVRFLLAVVTIAVSVLATIHIFKRPLKGGIYSIGATILGWFIIVLPYAHIMLLKSIRDGVIFIIFIHLIVMINDSGAYFGGVYFGKHKAQFKASPNKSWEGYFSGLLFGIVFAILYSQFIEIFYGRYLFSIIEAAIIGIIFSIIGNIGDLLESALKRDGSIKDSGSIIPGHGGMWDVFDSTIFSMPLFYYYLILRGII
ncbi:MAG TPA: phosphatidate cytidylyltransferase [Spirochaetota bacterium]|nr:phosphatidate cytidylyltransferase [Spirochaetota bacterium]